MSVLKGYNLEQILRTARGDTLKCVSGGDLPFSFDASVVVPGHWAMQRKLIKGSQLQFAVHRIYLQSYTLLTIDIRFLLKGYYTHSPQSVQ